MTPPYAQPIYDALIKDTDAAIKNAQQCNRKGVINALKNDANDVEKLIPTMRPTPKRTHEQEILEKLKALIQKLESGNGTFQDVYTFFEFVEKTLAQDV